MNRAFRKIGLLGFHGFGNLGDAAIQEAMIHNIRIRLPDAEIVGFSLNPDDTVRRHGIAAFPIAKRDLPRGNGAVSGSGTAVSGGEVRHTSLDAARDLLKRVPGMKGLVTGLRRVRDGAGGALDELWFVAENVRRLKDFDALVIAGGGVVDEEWGGAWKHPYSLFKWAWIARASNTQFLFFNVGASVLKSRLSRYFVGKALSLAQYRSYRDSFSMETCRTLNRGRREPVFPDPAFGYPLQDGSDGRPESGPVTTVGISPMGYCCPKSGVWPKQDQAAYREYIRKIRDFSIWLRERGCQVRFFPSQVRNDPVAIRDVLELLQGRTTAPEPQSPVHVAEEFEVRRLLEELARVDIVVASRLHGVILSYLMKRPTIALSYHPKVRSVAQDFGQERFLLNIDTFSVDELIDSFRRLEEELPSVKAGLRRKVEACRRRLQEQYDQVFGATGC